MKSCSLLVGTVCEGLFKEWKSDPSNLGQILVKGRTSSPGIGNAYTKTPEGSKKTQFCPLKQLNNRSEFIYLLVTLP